MPNKPRRFFLGFLLLFLTLVSQSYADKETQLRKIPDAPAPQSPDVTFAADALTQKGGNREGIGPDITSALNDHLSFISYLQAGLLMASAQSGSGGDGGETNIVEKNAVEAVESLMQSLSDSGASSERCVNDTRHLFKSMGKKKGWALKFLDAAGKPVPGISEMRVIFVGDYDLCRKQVVPPGSDTGGFTGNYVILKALIIPNANLSTPANLVIQWGACMPSTCDDMENTVFLSEVLNKVGLNKTLMALKAETRNDKRTPTTSTYVAIAIVVVISTMMIVSTLYDIIFVQLPAWKIEWAEKDMDSINSIELPLEGVDSPTSLKNQTANKRGLVAAKGKPAQLLTSFSVYTNGYNLLNTSQAQGSITCMHGIRFFSMAWVILGHAHAFGMQEGGNTYTELPIVKGSLAYLAVTNTYPAVDTFFTLSGLLLSYYTIKDMQKRGWKINWFRFYFHRYWRLTPPYMLSIAVCVGLAQYFGQGPLWPTEMPFDASYCRKHWWANMLYINNIYKREEPCFGHTWYLANDMQFFWLSPLMLLRLYFHKWVGLAVCGFFLLTTFITTGILSVKNEWITNLIVDSIDVRNYFNNYYIAPWCRIGPFVIGVLAGYLLLKRPKAIFKMSWLTALIGWLVAAATALAVVYGLHGDMSGENRSSVEVAAIYNAVSRTAWGASVSWVILACVAGRGGFVNTFLSWSPFVVLGRLTYMAYLLHPTVLATYYFNQTTLTYLSTVNFAATFTAVLVASYVVAFIATLAFEVPMAGLEKVILPGRKKH